MRASASASIVFGLVHVPIKVYAASESAADIKFHLLHKTCHSRLRQQYECPTENKIVPREATVKGYEYEKGRYVTFTPEELEALEADDEKTIVIDSFCKLEHVDTLYFDTRHFLGPDRGADPSYTLLARAMTKAKRVAVARYAARGKQHLVLLMAIHEKLVMQRLHYADEVRSLDDVIEVKDVKTSAADLKLALQLIKQLEQPKFDPSAYSDDVKARVQERINAKIDGREITITPSEKPGAQIIDMADALRASLGVTRGRSSSSSAKGSA